MSYENALLALKKYEDTGDSTSLYTALKLVVNANKREPENVHPLIRGLSNSVLEPLLIQIEKSLEDIRPKEEGEKKDKLGDVIFVDFVNRKRAA